MIIFGQKMVERYRDGFHSNMLNGMANRRPGWMPCVIHGTIWTRTTTR